MNLELAEIDKKFLRLGVKLISKKLNKNANARESSLQLTANKPIKVLNKLVIVTAEKLKAPWQAKTIKTFGQFALWLFLKDTAYRDAFFWALYKLLKMSDKLIPLVEPYVKEPKEWYPNRWIDGINNTNTERRKGKIPANEKSEGEKMFTPAIQRERFEKLNKR